jgi:hypothetical protein
MNNPKKEANFAVVNFFEQNYILKYFLIKNK